LEIDCNEHFYSGQLAQKKLEGRNYNYYLYEGDGKVFSTLMGCPGVEKRRVFVRTTTVTVPYNSRLPVVIYVPEQLEIRYKIWSRIEREYRAAKN
jgi:ecotin